MATARWALLLLCAGCCLDEECEEDLFTTILEDVIHDAFEEITEDDPPPLVAGTALVEIDLVTGDRRIVSGLGPVLAAPRAAVVDAAADRALVWDEQRRELLAVDLATGDRTVVARPLARDVRALALTGAGPVLAGTHLWRVDPATGTAVLLRAGAGPEALAADGDRVFVAADGAVDAVDPTTGADALVTGAGRGTGPPFGRVAGLAYDPGEDRLLLLDANDVLFGIDLAAGDRTVLSQPAGFPSEPGGLALTPFAALTAHRLPPGESLVAIDLPAGLRRVVSGAGVGTGPLPENPRAVLYDPRRRRALVLATP